MNSKQQYAILKETLNEYQWRIYLGTEAKRIGFSGQKQVSLLSGADPKTIRRGMLEAEKPLLVGRIRLKGGGRKKIQDKDSTLVKDLEKVLEPKGDPMSILQWTTKSLTNLVFFLESKKHTIKRTALRKLLIGLGFSLKGNKKNIEGKSHPDRDEQFKHIKKSCEEFEKQKDPIISVDCKKKELIGNFKNNGKEWQAKGKNTIVNVYDFQSIADGKAAPYGIYDVINNSGFVNVGIDHDTASFAVESIRKWWNKAGKILYPTSKELLITSDGGGSNGVRNKLWKKELQNFVNESKLTITVNHLPPATSKWNKIEHKLFSYISINWRNKPLTSLEMVIELISHTTSKTGLKVEAVLDQNKYPIGIKVTDKELALINIQRNEWHGEWNYTIRPQGC